MDMTWVTDRIAVGGGIWNDENMEELVNVGVTHIIDMQIEFDDRPIAEPYAVKVLYSPADDDFQPKPPELFQRGVEFALEALNDAKDLIQRRRYVVDFADVYVESVENFVRVYEAARAASSGPQHQGA